MMESYFFAFILLRQLPYNLVHTMKEFLFSFGCYVECTGLCTRSAKYSEERGDRASKNGAVENIVLCTTSVGIEKRADVKKLEIERE